MIQAILTDIEGTTSSLAFVKEVLFPYARKHMAQFIADHSKDPAVRRELEAVAEAMGRPLSDEEAAAQLVQWIEEDRKFTPLKALQGMIWEQGYHRGDFHGHLYEDALRNLRAWYKRGLKLYVFSSGSIQAQKLLFSYTEAGDLTPLFSGYFDTRMGAKQDVNAYRSIAHAIDLPAEQILFLSDIKKELDAAHQAGMQTTWLIRDQDPEFSPRHPQVCNFDGIRV